MFDMGFLELMLVGIIALIVLGPERLPRAARTVGLWVGKAKQGFESIKTEIDRELQVKELQQKLKDEKSQLESDLNVDSELSALKDDVSQTVNQIHQQVNELEQSHSLKTDQPRSESSAKPSAKSNL